MCCLIDSFLSDLFTLVRQLLAYFQALICKHLLIKTNANNTNSIEHFNNLFSRARQRDDKESEGEREDAKEVRSASSSRRGNFVNYKQHSENIIIDTEAGRERREEEEEKRIHYNYKMMSKKGLLKFVKYTLIFSNAFGFILCIFLGLFGIAYSDKQFPLSYKGREMAFCSLCCMVITTIGYCGATNHKKVFLIMYGLINVGFVIFVVVMWIFFKENSILGNKEISNMFITTLAITIAVMCLFSFILARYIQEFKSDANDSIVTQSHQLLQQTTAFLQQQQQQFAAAAAAAAAASQQHHHHQPFHNQQQHLQLQTNFSSGSNDLQSQMNPATSNNAAGPLIAGSLQRQQQFGNNSQPGTGAAPAATTTAPGGGVLGPDSVGGLQLQPQQALPAQMNSAGQYQQQPFPPAPPLPPMIKQIHRTTGPGTGLAPSAVSAKQQQQAAAGQLTLAATLQLPPPQIHSQVPQQQQQQQSSSSSSNQQIALMRNQSSPLPAASYQPPQNHPRSSGNQPQQLKGGGYKQAAVRPPAPSPPSIHSAHHAHAQQQAHHNHHHHHHHHHQSMREHHQRALNSQQQQVANSGRIPSCPVQYCTFQCDETV